MVCLGIGGPNGLENRDVSHVSSILAHTANNYLGPYGGVIGCNPM